MTALDRARSIRAAFLLAKLRTLCLSRDRKVRNLASWEMRCITIDLEGQTTGPDLHQE